MDFFYFFIISYGYQLWISFYLYPTISHLLSSNFIVKKNHNNSFSIELNILIYISVVLICDTLKLSYLKLIQYITLKVVKISLFMQKFKIKVYPVEYTGLRSNFN